MTVYSVRLQYEQGFFKQVYIVTSREEVAKDLIQKDLLYFGRLWIVSTAEHTALSDLRLTGQVFVFDSDRVFLEQARAILDNPAIMEYEGSYETKMAELKQVLRGM